MSTPVIKAILNDRKIAYLTTDRELQIERYGGAIQHLCTDSTPAECPGRALTDLVPELIGNETVLQEILAGTLDRFELGFINREDVHGHTIYITAIIQPRQDLSHSIEGLLVIIQDVTETGTIQQELTQHRNDLALARRTLEAANSELRHLSEMKSQFVSIAAHELRSPLTSIVGYLEMLEDGDFGTVTPEQRRAIATVAASADQLLATTNGLLDVARIEAGRIELDLRETDLAPLLTDVIAAYQPLLESKGLRITTAMTASLPAVLCDRKRMQQILGNLISNAIKYTNEDGQLEVELRKAEEPGYLLFSVTDDGVGIPTEDQPHIFTRFFRAGTASQTGASGSGLGLFIVRELVTLHGGQIWFESAVGIGTTFYVMVPTAR